MRPRRTHTSTTVHRLPGGNEDSDLWTEDIMTDHGQAMESVWEPSDDERAQIAAGANIELVVWGTRTPPLAVGVTTVPLGKAPDQPTEGDPA